MVLAVPGAALMALSRAANGNAVTATMVGMSWLWFLAMGAIGAALAVWSTKRRLFRVALVIGALLVAVWFLTPEEAAASDIEDLFLRWRAMRLAAGPALPLGAALLALVVGTELFARGLASYDGRKA